MESGIHSLPYNVCEDQFQNTLFPPSEQEIWHYQKANVDQIRQAISEFPWDNRFANIYLN